MLRPILLIALLVLILDQASKWVILLKVMDPPRVIEVTGFFNLVLAWNRGVSFGLFTNDSPYGPYLLAGIALVIATGVLLWSRNQRQFLPVLAAGMIVGGAIGNLIDRLVHGAVVDFLDFHVGGFHWPAFNVADCGIVVGVGFLLYDSLFRSGRSTK
ncbi:MAG: signal peptidase II [Kiloniellales bacterium]